MVTDKEIRAAVKVLQEAEAKSVAKVNRHYQHKKKEYLHYAWRGCKKCQELLNIKIT